MIVEIPIGQDVQDDEPAEEYDPAEQIIHPAALYVPEFVTNPAYPGAQIEHAETDELPNPDVVIPRGQDVHEVPVNEDEF